jgi:tetratricopeptide (TPR) repeat protein
LPYQQTTQNSNPSSCLIIDYPGVCANKFTHSLCSSNGFANYPAYDPRCRSWYDFGETMNDPSMAYFQYPRVSSSGQFVLTGVVPIHQNNSLSGPLYGVLTSNYLISTLSEAINSLTILKTGYCYLIDSANVSNIILHPNLPKSCSQVQCAEGLSDSDFHAFHERVLTPIQNEAYSSIPSTYKKNKKTWRITAFPVNFGSVKYSLLITVPDSEVTEASDDTQASISFTVTGMIIAFVFAIVFFIVTFVYFTRALVHAIVKPLNDLRLLFHRVINEDYSVEIPSKASSYDLKVLLKALSNLLIALRFGSETFARGNPHLAETLFNDALKLFQSLSNEKGVGSCLNNLAMVELSKRNYPKAKEYMNQSVENGVEVMRKLVAKEENTVVPLTISGKPKQTVESIQQDIKRLQKVLSDRQGNLVVIYLEENSFQLAFELLEKLLEEDKNNLYIRGCVIKQGTLGQYYLKQKEFSSAEKIFLSSLQFIDQGKKSIQSTASNNGESDWNPREIDLSEQIALYNMILLNESKEGKQKKTEDVSSLEKLISQYLHALTSVQHMHTNTTKNLLISLKGIYFQKHSSLQKYEKDIDEVATLYDFNLTGKEGGTKMNSGSSNSGFKRVAFAIDYSGSMSGTKIRSAVENLQMIFRNYIGEQDYISIVQFNQTVTTLLPLTVKVGQEAMIEEQIQSLKAPNGSTAFYDAVNICLKSFGSSSSPSSGSDWIVALTDGEDNGSMMGIPSLQTLIAQSNVGLIIVGVGSDVHTEILTSLTAVNKKGVYVAAQGDKKSIDEAFGQVIQIIQSQIVMEDI